MELKKRDDADYYADATDPAVFTFGL